MNLVIKRFNELTLEELYQILKLRNEVFIMEQQCPYLDIDGKDPLCTHLFLLDQKEIVAYTRVMPDGQALGRVIAKRRREGLGTKIVNAAMDVCIHTYHSKKIVIEAQTYVRHLYEQCGFKQTSAPFLEDGIEHIWMTWEEKIR